MGAFAILGQIRRLQRLRDWALEQQAEQAPQRPSLPPQPLPEPAEPRSIEDRFWTFFSKVSPHLLPPWHFRVYVRRVLQAVGGDLRLVFAAPPQHGKTEVTLALIAFLVLEHEGRRWAYVTYNQRRANSVARKFKRILANAGVVVGGALAQMYLPNGGQILFTSVDGGLTGEPVDGAVFIDDPYKNRKEADSQARRQLVEETYRDAVEPRVHPGGSIFLLATRWHPQDLSGQLVDEDWEYINLQALAEGEANDNGIVLDDPNERRVGEPLFPEKWPADALAKKRAKVLEFTWAALYQGRPRPKGGTVFHEPSFYQALPKQYRGAFGLDLASTAKTSADHSVCLELWRAEHGPEGQPGPFFYVVNIDAKQVEAPAFALTLKARHVQRPLFKMRWRASGTEKMGAQFLQRMKLPVVVSQPPGDKFVSATEVAIAWNDGRVLVPDEEAFPECMDWLYLFLDCVSNFTGTGNEFDDPVDALGNAHAELDTRAVKSYSSLRGLRGSFPKRPE
jgi:hypothetical protein